jgi:Lrp/AsnC family leucine-responsive transcriptional regulator
MGQSGLGTKGGRVDRVDWHILAELQADARLSFNELSRRVKLSAPAVADRVRRLEDSGVIAGYHALVDPVRAGRPMRAVIRMQCYGPTCLLRDPEVRRWPELQQLHRVTGDDCCVLVIAVPDSPAFEALLDRLAGYGRPTSSLILDDGAVAWSPILPT